jgi:hypothetical protein
MEAIRKKKIKCTGGQIVIDLPEDFKADEVDAILWPSDTEIDGRIIELDRWKQEMDKLYSKFNVNLGSVKFNRDKLYDRS